MALRPVRAQVSTGHLRVHTQGVPSRKEGTRARGLWVGAPVHTRPSRGPWQPRLVPQSAVSSAPSLVGDQVLGGRAGGPVQQARRQWREPAASWRAGASGRRKPTRVVFPRRPVCEWCERRRRRERTGGARAGRGSAPPRRRAAARARREPEEARSRGGGPAAPMTRVGPVSVRGWAGDRHPRGPVPPSRRASPARRAGVPGKNQRPGVRGRPCSWAPRARPPSRGHLLPRDPLRTGGPVCVH